MDRMGLKPVWKKRLANLAVVALFVLAFENAPWMGEYFAHRDAVLPVSRSGSSSLADSESAPGTKGAPFSRMDGSGFPSANSGSGKASLQGRLVPDAIAESHETVLTGPNPEIRERLVALIRNAKKELLLNVYLLTETSVTDALVDAKKRGVDVKVILEKDPYKLPGANRKSRDRLLNAGVEVFSSRDAFAFVHAKFAVADGVDYVFATGNFTKSTFEKNREFFVFWNDPASANFLRSVFLADFRGSPFVGSVPDRFYLAPVDARKKAVEFVRRAKKSVTVLAPSVSDDEFVKALNDASEAGLKVRVCILKDASPADLARFSDKVAAVRTSRAQLHAKTVLADGSELLIGSANFTSNSLDRNRETGAVFGSSGIVRDYENTVFRDCKW